jgi:hypothetical protein
VSCASVSEYTLSERARLAAVSLSDLENRRLRIAGLVDAGTINTKVFRRELGLLPSLLLPSEEVRVLCKAVFGDSLWSGLLIVTDQRLMFVRFRAFPRQRFLRVVARSEIHAVHRTTFARSKPSARIVCDSGKHVEFKFSSDPGCAPGFFRELERDQVEPPS